MEIRLVFQLVSGLPEQPGHQDHKESREFKDQLGRKVTLEFRELPGQPDPRDQLVFKDRKV